MEFFIISGTILELSGICFILYSKQRPPNLAPRAFVDIPAASIYVTAAKQISLICGVTLWYRCILDGYCYKPSCWYGRFNMRTRFCPCLKTLSYNSWKCRRDQLRVILRRRHYRVVQQSLRQYHRQQQQQQQQLLDLN